MSMFSKLAHFGSGDSVITGQSSLRWGIDDPRGRLILKLLQVSCLIGGLVCTKLPLVKGWQRLYIQRKGLARPDKLKCGSRMNIHQR